MYFKGGIVMKHIKKWLAVILTGALTVACAALPAAAEQTGEPEATGEYGSGYWLGGYTALENEAGQPVFLYKDNGDHVMIVACLDTDADQTEIVIPPTINDKPVVLNNGALDGTDAWVYIQADGQEIAYDTAEPTSLTFSEGTAAISGGFMCWTVEQVNLPSSAKAISDGAFSNCINLSKIQLPDGVEFIGANAFERCLALETLTIPASVQTVSANACAYGSAWVKYMGADTVIEDTIKAQTVYGYKNSTAETAAAAQEVRFVALGDANDDGYVNNKDFARCKAYLADDLTETETVAADITGDELVNNKDLARLKAYLADPV